MNCVRMNCKTRQRRQTYSFSNYNWNVQPANAIYQDSENCSHEENKYRFNFVRTTHTHTSTAGVNDICVQVAFVFFFCLLFFSLRSSSVILLSAECYASIFVLCKWKPPILFSIKCLSVFVCNCMRFPFVELRLYVYMCVYSHRVAAVILLLLVLSRN